MIKTYKKILITAYREKNIKVGNGSNRIEDIVRHLHCRFPEVDIGKVRMDVIKAVREKEGFF